MEINKSMRVFRCLFFLLFPFFIFKILHIKMKRVGFSLVLCRYIDMDVEATIGHFNLIIVDSLVMKKESRIGHLNFIKGGFNDPVFIISIRYLVLQFYMNQFVFI